MPVISVALTGFSRTCLGNTRRRPVPHFIASQAANFYYNYTVFKIRQPYNYNSFDSESFSPIKQELCAAYDDLPGALALARFRVEGHGFDSCPGLFKLAQVWPDGRLDLGWPTLPALHRQAI